MLRSPLGLRPRGRRLAMTSAPVIASPEGGEAIPNHRQEIASGASQPPRPEASGPKARNDVCPCHCERSEAISRHRRRLLRRLTPPRNDVLLRAEALGAWPSANGGGKTPRNPPHRGYKGPGGRGKMSLRAKRSNLQPSEEIASGASHPRNDI